MSKYLISTNPAHNYKIVGKVLVSSDKEITQAVEDARNAKLVWKELGLQKRIVLVKIAYAVFQVFEKNNFKWYGLVKNKIGEIHDICNKKYFTRSNPLELST